MKRLERIIVRKNICLMDRGFVLLRPARCTTIQGENGIETTAISGAQFAHNNAGYTGRVYSNKFQRHRGRKTYMHISICCNFSRRNFFQKAM